MKTASIFKAQFNNNDIGRVTPLYGRPGAVGGRLMSCALSFECYAGYKPAGTTAYKAMLQTRTSPYQGDRHANLSPIFGLEG